MNDDWTATEWCRLKQPVPAWALIATSLAFVLAVAIYAFIQAIKHI